MHNETAYEETFVWGICGSQSLLPDDIEDANNQAKKANVPSSDLGVSVGVSAGGWTNTGVSSHFLISFCTLEPLIHTFYLHMESKSTFLVMLIRFQLVFKSLLLRLVSP